MKSILVPGMWFCSHGPWAWGEGNISNLMSIWGNEAPILSYFHVHQGMFMVLKIFLIRSHRWYIYIYVNFMHFWICHVTCLPSRFFLGLMMSWELMFPWDFPSFLTDWIISSLKPSATKALPSGKRTKNYGKSPCLMGKSTINCHFQ